MQSISDDGETFHRLLPYLVQGYENVHSSTFILREAKIT